MKLFPILFFCLCLSGLALQGQDIESLTTEARALERKYKEDEALNVYKQILTIQPSNMMALVKCSELSGNIGRRTKGQIQVNAWLQQAMAFADAALKQDSNRVEAATIKANAFRNLAETEDKRDVATNYLRQWKQWSERALALDSGYGKAQHLLGRWHLEVLTQGGIRKAAGKLLYGGLPEPDLEAALKLMEKCKEKEPYYCLNFLDLARAYNFGKYYEKAIKTLEQLAKLPTRRMDDVDIKAEGALLLQTLQ